ncbi:cytochrome P450 [Penicillium robsamsonii]|uniref:cytochrome P450 n=1 Tax=Penicillium robsamsonii TaxID=1792511 RepID=UPI00254892A6|nr:cytochrome P450 [Penicillium robsamsonii]KAJ5837011.1 cytochrome P450 [Penicillium robsamsonii]
MKRRFLNNASALMREGFEQNLKSPRGFTIMSVNGPKLVLSPDYADELKNDARFSLEDAGLRDYPRSIDCLKPISGGNLQVLRGCIAKITRNLGIAWTV